VGPHYDPPGGQLPEQWKNGSVESSSPPQVQYWWEIFEDPFLNELELQAVNNNPNLYIALERVFEARAQTGVVAANLYPQLTLDPSFINSGVLFLPQFPPALLSSLGAAGGGAVGTALSKANAPFRVHQRQYLLPLNMSYEVDLWGQLHDQVDAASFNAEAQADNYLNALITLTADLATSYFQVRMLDAEILYLEETLKTRAKNLNLTKARNSQGLVNYLDVTQAEVDFYNVKANIDDAVRLRGIAENQVAVLIGMLPTDFQLAANPLEGDPPQIPAGLPSTMMLRRPDIAAAERAMASEHALVGAAYASYFPSLSLTGTLGFLSPDFSHFLRWISRLWSYGANMSQMVFDGGRIDCNLQLAYARFRQASGAYQQQVLTAFQEVEDALKAIEQYHKQEEHLQQVVVSASRATRLSTNRYVTGVAIYLEVMENERLELQAKINWINTLNARYLATIQLIKALGGTLL
jgi:multidrug efflux system outer membrane protein